MGALAANTSIQLIVPFYVGAAHDHVRFAGGDLRGLFDHPTPLGGTATLPRLLASLRELDPQPLGLSVVVAAGVPELLSEASRWAQRLIDEAALPFPVALLGDTEQTALVSQAENAAHLLDMQSYSGVRNLCLVAALQSGAEIALLLDDDEAIRQPDYLAALYRRFDADATLDALAGLYLEQGERIYVPRDEAQLAPWQAAFDPSAERLAAFAALEEAIGRGETEARPARFAFGGNLALRRRLMANLPFDLSALRGEDVDYALSARSMGHEVRLDPSLLVEHYPPPKTAPAEATLEQETRRYLSLQRKLACARHAAPRPLGLEELAPFPGAFLQRDLITSSAAAFSALGQAYAEQGRHDGASRTARAADRVAKHAIEIRKTNPWREYLSSAERWREFCRALTSANIA